MDRSTHELNAFSDHDTLDDIMSQGMMEAMIGNVRHCHDQKNQHLQQCHPIVDDVHPGQIFKQTLEDALKKLPHLIKEEVALEDLSNILDKVQAPLNVFDQVVSFMETHMGMTFIPGNLIDRQDAFHHKLKKRFTLPP